MSMRAEWPKAKTRAAGLLTREQLWEIARAQAQRLLRAFDPNEPRDPSGRWTDGGGSDGGDGSGGSWADRTDRAKALHDRLRENLTPAQAKRTQSDHSETKGKHDAGFVLVRMDKTPHAEGKALITSVGGFKQTSSTDHPKYPETNYEHRAAEGSVRSLVKPDGPTKTAVVVHLKPPDEPQRPPYSPGIKSRTFDEAKKVKQQWANESPVKNIEDAKRLAPEAHAQLIAAGKEIAAKLGIKTGKDPGDKISDLGDPEKIAKGIKRVNEKAAERADRGSYGAVSDLARMSFLINNPKQSDQIADLLAQKFETVTEPWRVTKEGYGDRAYNVRLPNGAMGEVQILEPRMDEAKNQRGGHDLYVVAREADPKNGTKPDKPKYDDAVAKMQKLYGDVIDQMSPDWKALLGRGGSSPKAARNSPSLSK